MRTGFGCNTYSQHRHINMVSGHFFAPPKPKISRPGEWAQIPLTRDYKPHLSRRGKSQLIDWQSGRSPQFGLCKSTSNLFRV